MTFSRLSRSRNRQCHASQRLAIGDNRMDPPDASIEIRVHAHFPLIIKPGAPLNLDPTNWKWVHCLTFPVDTLKRRKFSLRLYKWIRYATGTVIGAHGTLTTQSNSLDPINYDDDPPSESLDLYYPKRNNACFRLILISKNQGL
jgi:hypothetical protein